MERKRRGIIKAEYNAAGMQPPLCVVTNLFGELQRLYDKLYCIRGDMENRTKEQTAPEAIQRLYMYQLPSLAAESVQGSAFRSDIYSGLVHAASTQRHRDAGHTVRKYTAQVY